MKVSLQGEYRGKRSSKGRSLGEASKNIRRAGAARGWWCGVAGAVLWCPGQTLGREECWSHWRRQLGSHRSRFQSQSSRGQGNSPRAAAEVNEDGPGGTTWNKSFMKSVGTQVFNLTGHLLSVSFSSFVYPWLQDECSKKQEKKNHTFSPLLFIKAVSACFKSDHLYRKRLSSSEPSLVKVFNGRGHSWPSRLVSVVRGRRKDAQHPLELTELEKSWGPWARTGQPPAVGRGGPRPSGWASSDR